jgi:hypothetical protein
LEAEKEALERRLRSKFEKLVHFDELDRFLVVIPPVDFGKALIVVAFVSRQEKRGQSGTVAGPTNPKNESRKRGTEVGRLFHHILSPPWFLLHEHQNKQQVCAGEKGSKGRSGARLLQLKRGGDVNEEPPELGLKSRRSVSW